jgi:S1-C subfamily serine protease
MTASILSRFSSDLAALVATAAPAMVSIGSGHARSTGFLWRPGLIVTADEALPDEDSFTVTLAGGQSADARLVGRDAATDVALLRIEGPGSEPVALAPKSPAAGELAIAIGASDGAPTAALGLVAYAAGAWRSMRGGEIDARIDLDLRLPRGAEGGLVFDAEGKAIGMAVYGPRRRVLVIPIATIDRVAGMLESHGRIPRGYLGVGFSPVAVEGGDERGAMVMTLDKDGPGAAAGLHQGDIVVAWNGEPVRHLRTILRALGADSVGQTVTLGVLRGGKRHEIPVTIAERPAP